jgi:hypothetical protein
MVTDEDVLEAARAIRPYLPDLAPDVGEQLDGDLAALLSAAADGDDVRLDVARLLRSEPATREWTQEFLRLRQPPEVVKAFEPAPGHGAPVPALKFVCPLGDYVRYAAGVGERIESCPSHRLPLVPV